MNLYPIILAIVTLGGIAITLWGWRIMKKSQQTRQWPSVEGIIEESEATSVLDDLLPHIVYSYQVMGERYQRVFEFPSGTHPTPEFNQSYVKKYPVGARVKVYYDSLQPQLSILEPGAQGDWMILVLGILMTLGGIGTLLSIL